MKILRSIYALLALILVSMTFSRIRNSRSRGCQCKATEYCGLGDKCHPRTKKGGACSGGNQYFQTCEVGTTCQENPTTKKFRCADSANKTK